MNIKTQPFSITLTEIDNLLFEVLVDEFKSMYPNDHRMALRAGMHVADKAVVKFEPFALRAGKAAARAQADPATAQATQGAPAPAAAPTRPVSTPITPRKRRTKAEIEAAIIAKHAAQMAQATAGGQGVGSTTQQPQQPQPMGQQYIPAENLFAAPPQAQVAPYQPPPIPQAPQQASTPALLPQAPQQPAAPVVDNFAALAQAAAAGQVPQFAPPAASGPVPTPPPTFG